MQREGKKFILTNIGFVNVKTSAFKDHDRFEEHKSFVLTMQSSERISAKAIA